MFVELMPLLAGRTVLITVAKVDDKTLRVNVIPHGKADDNPALSTPLTYTGPPEELGAELGKHWAGYVQTHQQTASTLAEAKATGNLPPRLHRRERSGKPRRYSAHGPCKEVQEFESYLTSLGRVSLAYPDYARFNEAGGIGSKKETHGLAWGKGGVGLQAQAMRGEVNGSSEVFSLVTLHHESHSHLDPLTLRPALN